MHDNSEFVSESYRSTAISKRPFTGGLLSVIMLLVALPALMSAGPDGKKSKPKVIKPHSTSAPALKGIACPSDRSLVSSKKVKIVATTDQAPAKRVLAIDGKAVEAKCMPIRKPGLTKGRQRVALTVSVKLEPGEHTITLGNDKSRIWVPKSGGGDQSLPDWPKFRSHPPNSDNCRLYHAVKKGDDGPSLGPAKEPEVCFRCHEEDVFGLTHSHRLESLATCRLCHSVHGGPAKSLLIGEAKTLCLKCHD